MQLNHQESVLPESQLTEVQLEIELNGTFLNHAAKTVASIANNFDRSRLYKFQEVDSDVVIFECEDHGHVMHESNEAEESVSKQFFHRVYSGPVKASGVPERLTFSIDGEEYYGGLRNNFYTTVTKRVNMTFYKGEFRYRFETWSPDIN